LKAINPKLGETIAEIRGKQSPKFEKYSSGCFFLLLTLKYYTENDNTLFKKKTMIFFAATIREKQDMIICLDSSRDILNESGVQHLNKSANNKSEIMGNGEVVMLSFTRRHCRISVKSSEGSVSNEAKIKPCVVRICSRLLFQSIQTE
jgi:hypothetical protein